MGSALYVRFLRFCIAELGGSDALDCWSSTKGDCVVFRLFIRQVRYTFGILFLYFLWKLFVYIFLF